MTAQRLSWDVNQAVSLQTLDFFVFSKIFVLELNTTKYYYWVNGYI